MRKTIMTIAAAASIPAAAIATPKPAEARCSLVGLRRYRRGRNRWHVSLAGLRLRLSAYRWGYAYPAYGYAPTPTRRRITGATPAGPYYARRKCREDLGYGRTSGWGCG